MLFIDGACIVLIIILIFVIVLISILAWGSGGHSGGSLHKTKSSVLKMTCFTAGGRHVKDIGWRIVVGDDRFIDMMRVGRGW